MIDPITEYILRKEVNESIFLPLDIWALIKQNKEARELLLRNEAIAATVIIAAAVTIGAVIYKKFLSKAVVSCRKANDKESCVKKFRNDAIKKKIEFYEKTKSVCSKSKKPDKCKKSLQIKIEKEKSKLRK